MRRRPKIPRALTPHLYAYQVARIQALASSMNAKNVPTGGPAVDLRDVLIRVIDRGLEALEAPDVWPLLEPDDVQRLERAAATMSTLEVPVTINDVVRGTFAAGLEAIECFTKRVPWFRAPRKGGAP